MAEDRSKEVTVDGIRVPRRTLLQLASLAFATLFGGKAAARTMRNPRHGSRINESPLFARFTDRARRVMHLAEEEAFLHRHEYFGTEHILLGLVKEGSGVAANVLRNFDVDLAAARAEVLQIIRVGPQVLRSNSLPWTPRTSNVVRNARSEAETLGCSYVGTEHLLLSLLAEEDCVGWRTLSNRGLDVSAVRDDVLNLLGYGQV